ncbi:MAG: reverse transcriptase domain-containing protein [Pseudomonadota bacterium]
MSETHLRGQGEWSSSDGSECKLWKGVEGGVVWSGVSEGYKGKAKEGCAILVSKRVIEGVSEWGMIGSRIVWVKGKIGLVKYAWVCVYAPVNKSTKGGKKEMDVFWEEVSECVKKFEPERKIIVMGDMNAKVGEEEIEGVVGKWGVAGVNENGEYLVNICAERGLFLANTCFEHKMIHRYTWRRMQGEVEQKGLIDYVAVDERIRRDVMDAKVVRGMFQDSDHYAVMARIRLKEKWEFRERRDSIKKTRNEKLREEIAKEEYEKRFTEALSKLSEEERIHFGRGAKVLRETAEKVVGWRTVRVGGGKGGDAWWSEEIRKAVGEKRKAYEKKQEQNVPEYVKRERESEYKELKKKAKKEVNKARKKKDEEFGTKMGRTFKEDRKMFFEEVRKVRGGRKTICFRIKNKEGRLLRDIEEICNRWKEYHEEMSEDREGGRAIVSCLGMKGGERKVGEQVNIKRREVRRAIKRLKCGKSPGVDGVTAEMLKAGGEAVVEWLTSICQRAWEEGEVPAEWVQAIIVPIYKGKGCKTECTNYRGISLLSIPGKVYGRVLIERVKEITEGRICGEQGAFMKGKGCIDQIFTVKGVAEKYIAKGKKLYAAFMDLEKAYDKVEWEGMWNVLRIYGVGGQLLDGIKAFYKGANACVRIKGKLSDCFQIKRGVRQGCVMSPWLFNIYMDGVIREMKARVMERGVELIHEERAWHMTTSLFADDTVLLAGSERELQQVVEEFNRVCMRRKLKVNVGKSKVMVFERGKSEVIDFGRPYRIGRIQEEECYITMNGERLEEVSEFKYLGTVLSKYGDMEKEVKERVMQGKRVDGTLESIMRNKKVGLNVKKGLRDSIVLPTLTYGSETWTWNTEQQSKVRAVEMNYLRRACGVSRVDRERNEDIYARFGMSEKGVGVNCGVVEWVKRNTLRWFGHVERMEGGICKKVYESEVSGPGVRGRPPVKWLSRVEEYMKERNVRGLNAGRELCRDRDRWRRLCRGHPP